MIDFNYIILSNNGMEFQFLLSPPQRWRVCQPQSHFPRCWTAHRSSHYFRSAYAGLAVRRRIEQRYIWGNSVKNEAEENDEEKDKNLEESAYSFQKNYDKSHIEILELRKTKKASYLIDEEEDNVGFFRKKKYFFLSVDTVENRAPCFFGHFSIVVCACIMYSPFIYQSIMGLIYLIMMILMLIFEAWKYPRSLKFVVGGSF